jgi:hypothetical protein
MDNQLQQANITISSAEFTNWGLKIKDEKGLIYNISQYKKGTQDETMAYVAITSLPKNGLGLRKCVKFAVVPNSQGGQSRYVRIIEEPAIQASQATQGSYNPKTSSNHSKQNADDAWGKCKHAFLVEAFKWILNGNEIPEEVAEKRAEKWADMSMRKMSEARPAQPAQPDYEQPEPDDYFPEDEDVKIENIPF